MVASSSRRFSGLGEGFSRAEPDAVAEVEKIVTKIVAARGYGIPPEDRRDIGQEIMGQLWQAVRRPGFDPGERFVGFIEVVSSRRCVDWYRAQRPIVELDPELRDRRADAGDRAARGDRRRQVREAVEALPAACRELLTLRFGREMSYRELAARLGASEGTIRVRLHRCIGKARERLRPQNVVRIDSRKMS